MPDAYAGEPLVCYVALRPGASVTEDELHEHAQRTIGERSAWPKQIHVVDAIPRSSVGKIYKPQSGAQVQAREGGRRGMQISVTLPEAARLSVPVVEQALAAYLFETLVAVG